MCLRSVAPQIVGEQDQQTVKQFQGRSIHNHNGACVKVSSATQLSWETCLPTDVSLRRHLANRVWWQRWWLLPRPTIHHRPCWLAGLKRTERRVLHPARAPWTCALVSLENSIINGILGLWRIRKSTVKTLCDYPPITVRMWWDGTSCKQRYPITWDPSNIYILHRQLHNDRLFLFAYQKCQPSILHLNGKPLNARFHVSHINIILKCHQYNRRSQPSSWKEFLRRFKSKITAESC